MTEPPTRHPRPPDLTRRTLTPVGYAVCLAVPILIAAIGFAFLHFHYNKEQLVSGDPLRILTSERLSAGGATDRAVGELVLGDDGCLRLHEGDGSDIDLVWPPGYEATVQEVGQSKQIKVYDTDRTIVARSQQTVELDGGVGSTAEYAGRPCDPSSGQAFFVQPGVRVVGAAGQLVE